MCVCVCVCTLYASEALILLTSHVKVRPYTAFDNASRADDACSRFSGLINWWRHTHARGTVGQPAEQGQTITQGQINKLQCNYTGPEQTLQLHRQDSFVYKCSTVQWECVSTPTSSPLAIIFLCVSASVSTATFTPNNWRSTTTSARSTAPPMTNTRSEQKDVMPLSSILGTGCDYVWWGMIGQVRLRADNLGWVFPNISNIIKMCVHKFTQKVCERSSEFKIQIQIVIYHYMGIFCDWLCVECRGQHVKVHNLKALDECKLQV